MNPVLIVEIVSALVALAALVYLVIYLVRTRGGRRRLASDSSARHIRISIVLCVAVAIHGAAAMAYSSGAPTVAYALGWASLAAFVLSGACMMAPLRARLHSPLAWHMGLFVAGALLMIAHVIAGRA